MARLVDGASRLLLARGVHRTVFLEEHRPLDPDRPVLYCANHVSWWDGFLVRMLHKRGSTGPLYTVMLESELRRHPVLRRAGAIGLTPGSVSSIRALLRFLKEHATRGGRAVALYPQGRIWPSSRRPLGFQHGLRVIADAMQAPLVVPVALHLEPLNHPRPTAFVLAGRPIPWTGGGGAETVESAVGSGLDRIASHLSEWGEAAPDAWSSPFRDPGPSLGPHPEVTARS